MASWANPSYNLQKTPNGLTGSRSRRKGDNISAATASRDSGQRFLGHAGHAQVDPFVYLVHLVISTGAGISRLRRRPVLLEGSHQCLRGPRIVWRPFCQSLVQITFISSVTKDSRQFLGKITHQYKLAPISSNSRLVRAFCRLPPRRIPPVSYRALGLTLIECTTRGHGKE